MLSGSTEAFRLIAAASWPDAIIALAVPLNTLVLLLVAIRQTAANTAARNAEKKAAEAVATTHTMLRKINGTAVDPTGKTYTITEHDPTT